MGYQYNQIESIELDNTCVDITQRQWDKLMLGATKANKRIINSLVKKLMPSLYEGLSLSLYNPYDYLKTDTHLILVHSGIEYFLKIN